MSIPKVAHGGLPKSWMKPESARSPEPAVRAAKPVCAPIQTVYAGAVAGSSLPFLWLRLRARSQIVGSTSAISGHPFHAAIVLGL
ncbi:hypothetical protein THER5_1913 [Bifidobacterium thermacidophilum subsp. thermacidophilum]|uniref:Uncharacterized protein n=1 Tax=Bifidobacterium thermacidophilum subsp. thermacidophilum TaxID=79262 RepID=A0A087E2S5_9BIFI|nr:hypothetical protein THER5_1913 [Bifidobacterium thermacidophilum subsp. thermacidophilum]